MRILVVNKFLHHVGGVESYVRWQANTLREHGHDLHFFGMEPPPGSSIMPELGKNYTLTPNRDYNSGSARAVGAALKSVYSFEVGKLFQAAVDEFYPDVVHVHSTCRQLTPSVAQVIGKLHLPSVLTLHEYKQVCATQRLWDERSNRICTACVDAPLPKRLLNIAERRCVRGSTLASLAASPEVPIADYYWQRSGAILHAPSRFIAGIMNRSTFVKNQVVFADLPWTDIPVRKVTAGWQHRVLFLGRLEYEKGVHVLLNAWPRVMHEVPDATLLIAGDGSRAEELKRMVREQNVCGVEFRGRYERAELPVLLGQSAVTVHPALWHENSPYAVRESLLSGLPAIVSDVGGLSEMVTAQTGSVVEADNPELLASAIVSELNDPRAGTDALVSAVRARAIGDREHLKAMSDIYALAQKLTAGDASRGQFGARPQTGHDRRMGSSRDSRLR